MITRIIIYLLPILIPFIGYIFWTRIIYGRAIVSREGPWMLLSAAGLVLAIVTMIVFRIVFQGAAPGGTYTPPHIKDGVLVPSQVIPAEPETEDQ